MHAWATLTWAINTVRVRVAAHNAVVTTNSPKVSPVNPLVPSTVFSFQQNNPRCAFNRRPKYKLTESAIREFAMFGKSDFIMQHTLRAKAIGSQLMEIPLNGIGHRKLKHTDSRAQSLPFLLVQAAAKVVPKIVPGILDSNWSHSQKQN